MSYYKHHVFFCLNKRDPPEACCANHDAEALQFIVGWRDNAWANAEKLAAAPTPAARAAVAAEIETAAATTSRGLLAATTSASPADQRARNDYCVAHRR